MHSFRLVILDYAKNLLGNTVAQKILSDMMFVKQKNYERTDQNYVVIDKHDMIGTHILIYDTTNFFEPKIVSALRIAYQDRAQLHKIKIPIQDIVPHLDSTCAKAFQDYQNKYPVFADCGSWFIEPGYSLKRSGINISDLCYAMVFLQLKRRGIRNFVGCSNEKFKTHRHVENIGRFKKGYEFKHPSVPDPHMLILMEELNQPYIKSVYESYQRLFDNLIDIKPENENYKSIKETIHEELIKPYEHKIAS